MEMDSPKEHHVFDVLHWVKAAFKKHALDDIKESDCLNKEAFRCVAIPTLCCRDLSHRTPGCTYTFVPASCR